MAGASHRDVPAVHLESNFLLAVHVAVAAPRARDRFCYQPQRIAPSVRTRACEHGRD